MSINVKLSDGAKKAIKRIAALENCDFYEALEKAIRNQLYISEQKIRGDNFYHGTSLSEKITQTNF